MQRVCFATAAVLFAVAASPALGSDFRGKGTFPQFRNLSALPGGGFGVRSDGTPGIDGALSLSTPIGYSLTDYRVALAYGNLSGDRKFRFSSPSREGIRGSNGTGTAMIGIPVEGWRVTVSGMLLSGRGDNSLNLQVQPPTNDPNWSFSFGAQDVFSNGGAAGVFHPNDEDNSRSLFAVSTYKFQNGIYASFGVGTERFRRPFANVSAPVGDRVRLAIEHDGYGWNGLALGNVATIPGFGGTGRDGALNLGLGLVKGKYPFWTVSFTF